MKLMLYKYSTMFELKKCVLPDFYLKSLVIIETSNICLQIQLKTREMSYLNVKGKGLSNQNDLNNKIIIMGHRQRF